MDADLQIGDLIRLKRNLSARLSHPLETPESMGLGIIIDKLTELFIFPHENNKVFEYDSGVNPLVYSDQPDKNKDVVKTKICKVYWFKINKTKWEYEDDLLVAQVQTTFS